MAIYDPEVARKGVLEIWEQLNALHKKVVADAAPTAEAYEKYVAEYKEFPITYQINWGLTEHTPEDAQKIADEIREKLTAASQQLGKSESLPRLFYAGN